MNNNILETRRVFYLKNTETWEYVWVKNPAYDINMAREYAIVGQHYAIEDYIEKEIPRTVKKKKSHIEYRIKCEHCGGTKGWVRRKDAKFCTSNCRKLAGKEKSK